MDDRIETNNKKIQKLVDFLITNYEFALKNNDVIQSTIGALASVKSGFAFKSSSWAEDGTKVVKIKNITEQGQIDFSECSYVNDESVINKAEQFKVYGGELVIAMTGATIGKMAIIPKTESYALINQRVGLFMPKDSKKCTPFLYASCMRNDVFSEIVTRGGGSAQPNISGQSIEDISIPLLNQTEIQRFNNKFNICLSTIQETLEINKKLYELKSLYLQKFFG